MTRILSVLLFISALALTGTAAEIPADTIRLDELQLEHTVTKLGISTVLNTALSTSIKHSVDKTRPDGTDSNSFPSRHTIWAFSIGSTVTYQMAHRSAWWGIASQAAASAVGFQRVLGKRHYPEDVLAGAAIGIADNAIANIVTSLIFGPQNFYSDWHRSHNDVMRSLSVSTGIELPLRHNFGNLHIGPSLVSDIKFSQPLTRHWAFTASTAFHSAILEDRDTSLPALGTINAVSVQAGADVSTSFGSSPFALAGELSAGYLHRFSLYEGPIRHSSYVAAAILDFSIMLTKTFALGVRSSMSVTASPVKGYSPLPSATFSFYSRTTF